MHVCVCAARKNDMKSLCHYREFISQQQLPNWMNVNRVNRWHKKPNQLHRHTRIHDKCLFVVVVLFFFFVIVFVVTIWLGAELARMLATLVVFKVLPEMPKVSVGRCLCVLQRVKEGGNAHALTHTHTHICTYLHPHNGLCKQWQPCVCHLTTVNCACFCCRQTHKCTYKMLLY